jgi:hypothetical protein
MVCNFTWRSLLAYYNLCNRPILFEVIYSYVILFLISDFIDPFKHFMNNGIAINQVERINLCAGIKLFNLFLK